ncbi:MAG TPA: MarR family winged helix-turn-helix transcriptional regulator [Sphingomonas sp.]|jgi:DNA-binding MarR family transcriptional regulator|uniref:MarR family winged helix-turn-helix transcriptional regulator n=1 Tax=Sphingomonas sp. TaxID=28214 RepID=UPI002EDAE1DA
MQDEDDTHDRDTAALAPTSQLAGSVAFQLRLAQAASFQAYSERAAEPGLRPGRYAILQFIADHPGIGQTGLSHAVGRDKTTLTPTLADLERRGLIVRAPDPRDGRARRLSLTDAGHGLLARLADHARAHDARVDAILGPDRAVLLALLARLIRGLDGPAPDGD